MSRDEKSGKDGGRVTVTVSNNQRRERVKCRFTEFNL